MTKLPCRFMRSRSLAVLLCLALMAAGCSDSASEIQPEESVTSKNLADEEIVIDAVDEKEQPDLEEGSQESLPVQTDTATFSLASVPAYSGSPYVAVNGNTPYFDVPEDTASFEYYSDLDSLGRCQAAWACIGQDLMPTEQRESISSIYPTGWVNNSYDFVDGGYVYNRCHLIGFQLTGENANEKNLITGTRTMNVKGMLPFENMTADYIKETGNHVWYRVTPVFEGENLVASGVLMEAMSVEDEGDGILFCVWCYNEEPGVRIDYSTGENWEEGRAEIPEVPAVASADSEDSAVTVSEETMTYVVNTNTNRFHFPECSSVSDMKEKNRWDYTGTRQWLIDNGYKPCGRCSP